MRIFLWILAALFLVPLAFSIARGMAYDGSWRDAPRHSAGLAPDPTKTQEAVVQIYTARAFSWRGYVATHPWIIIKRAGAKQFDRYEVVACADGGIGDVAVGRRALGDGGTDNGDGSETGQQALDVRCVHAMTPEYWMGGLSPAKSPAVSRLEALQNGLVSAIPQRMWDSACLGRRTHSANAASPICPLSGST